ncbi:MAG: Gx transporter family protein [Spirochaetia bacterium]|nr:Gx transporter family protein [Spirochaetia bacterium]MBQ6674198.1 Gx transporter family protein [Spirochaetia bacterium]
MTQTTDKKLLPFLAALCLFLAAVEYAIPKPLPFLRLGLANLPVIVALFVLPTRDIYKLILLKIIGQALVTGTLFSYIFLFSAAGSAASGLTMLGVHLWLKNRVSCIGLSLAGAAANNIAQLVVAYFVLFGSATRYIAPILLISGAVTGLVLGIFTQMFIEKSKWFRGLHA